MEGWHASPSFAEQAEALGMTTSQIVAVADNVEVVTYVLDPEEENPDAQVYAAVLLRRHEDNILGAWLAGIPAGTLGEIRAVAHRRYGDPPTPDDPS